MQLTSKTSTWKIRCECRTNVLSSRPAAVRRRRMRYFKRADGWFNRFVRLAAVAHEGFWLGCLSADDLSAITAEHYAHSHESASPEHNLRGFFRLGVGGGAAALSSSFAHSRNGGGREVLALRRAGYQADGFECDPALVQTSAAMFEQLGEPGGVMLCPADQVPPGPPVYGGLIVGWSAYTHIPTRARRVAFLQALRQRALLGSPRLAFVFCAGWKFALRQVRVLDGRSKSPPSPGAERTTGARGSP